MNIYIYIKGFIGLSYHFSGDIAEVAILQGPRVQGQMYFGPTGEWNDTTVPRIFYMDQRNDGFWQITDAEAKGGIDGMLLKCVTYCFIFSIHNNLKSSYKYLLKNSLKYF